MVLVDSAGAKPQPGSPPPGYNFELRAWPDLVLSPGLLLRLTYVSSNCQPQNENALLRSHRFTGERHESRKKVLREVFAAARIRPRKSRTKIPYFLFRRRGQAFGIFWFHTRQRTSAKRNTHRILVGHAQGSGPECGSCARSGREDSRRPGSVSRLQSGLLRIFFRGPRREQVGDLLPGKSDHCEMNELRRRVGQ